MSDINFSIEEADAEFMRLIDEFNDAAQNYLDGDGGSRFDACEQALMDYGAWIEEIDGWQYFRHPSRKAAQS